MLCHVTDVAHLPVSRRERARAATVAEIKTTALSLMRGSETLDVRFVDIAREMGMTAPALYRYFADRDALLTALIVDAFDDLGAALAQAGADVGPDDHAARCLASCHAYRSWVQREPQRFALVFGQPAPGYVAPEDGPTTEAAQRALGHLQAIVVRAVDDGVIQPPLVPQVTPGLAAALAEKQHASPSAEQSRAIPAPTYAAMLHVWSMLHGFVTLEAHGHYCWLAADVLDAMFDSQLRLSLRILGIPVAD